MAELAPKKCYSMSQMFQQTKKSSFLAFTILMLWQYEVIMRIILVFWTDAKRFKRLIRVRPLSRFNSSSAALKTFPGRENFLFKW